MAKSLAFFALLTMSFTLNAQGVLDGGFAAARVSGLAALVSSKAPHLRPEEMKQVIISIAANCQSAYIVSPGGSASAPDLATARVAGFSAQLIQDVPSLSIAEVKDVAVIAFSSATCGR
jgi:hypothetical protein